MAIIKIRRDTAANWSTANPVLAAGELGIETDTGRIKFGNGGDNWNDLLYATAGFGGVSGTFEAKTGNIIKVDNGIITDLDYTPASDFVNRYGISDTDLTLWLDSKVGSNTTSYWEDLSGNSFNGVQSTGSYQPNIITDGDYGDVYDFDGVDDHLNIPYDSVLNITGQITLICWVKLDNWIKTVNKSIIHKGERWDDWGFDFQGYHSNSTDQEHYMRCHSPKNTDDTYYFYDFSKWYQCGFTFDNSTDTIIYYRNGSSVNTFTETGSMDTSTKDITIGYDGANSSNILDGKLAQIMVFKRVLSASEILDIYNADKTDFGY